MPVLNDDFIITTLDLKEKYLPQSSGGKKFIIDFDTWSFWMTTKQ